MPYRIYSNKRRTPDAALIRGIPYNQEKHYKTILKQHRQLIFLRCYVLLFKVYFSARAVSSLSRILAMRSSDVRAVNFAGTTSPTSLFRFPVTCAHSLFPASASRKFFKRRPRISAALVARKIK